jgi:hypothetical protein
MRRLTEDEKLERNRQQMTEVIAGLDRAVEWIKQNRDNLVGGFMLHPNRNTGIEIILSTIHDFDDDPKLTDHIRRLFAGRSVNRTRRTDGEEFYNLQDDELRLTFRWSVYRANKKTERETETVVI